MSEELVRKVKQDLEDAGVDLSGPCGAFEITQRVAWEMRGEGYGLLGGKTPAQNGCSHEGERYAVDWILKADGQGVDILGDAGGANNPQWAEEEADPSFYRPAFEPAEIPETPEEPPVEPPDGSEDDYLTKEDLEPIYEEIDALKASQADANARFVQLVNELNQIHKAIWEALNAVDAKFSKLRVEGSTSRRLAHAHDVKLEVKVG